MRTSRKRKTFMNKKQVDEAIEEEVKKIKEICKIPQGEEEMSL